MLSLNVICSYFLNVKYHFVKESDWLLEYVSSIIS